MYQSCKAFVTFSKKLQLVSYLFLEFFHNMGKNKKYLNDEGITLTGVLTSFDLFSLKFYMVGTMYTLSSTHIWK